jgi:hypothetical protein
MWEAGLVCTAVHIGIVSTAVGTERSTVATLYTICAETFSV